MENFSAGHGLIADGIYTTLILVVALITMASGRDLGITDSYYLKGFTIIWGVGCLVIFVAGGFLG